MKRTASLQEMRKQRFEEVLDPWTEKRLTQEEAAPAGCLRGRTGATWTATKSGNEGLADRRLSEVSARRAPVDDDPVVLADGAGPLGALLRDGAGPASAGAGAWRRRTAKWRVVPAADGPALRRCGALRGQRVRAVGARRGRRHALPGGGANGGARQLRRYRG